MLREMPAQVGEAPGQCGSLRRAEKWPMLELGAPEVDDGFLG